MVIGASDIGHQELGVSQTPRPSLAERWRERSTISPFGTMQASLFNLPRPIGTQMPEPRGVTLARLNADDPEITGAIAPQNDTPERPPALHSLVYPAVERGAKADFLGSPQAPASPPPPDAAESPLHDDMKAGAGDRPSSLRDGEDLEAAARAETPGPELPDGETADMADAGEYGTTRLYFDGAQTGLMLAGLEPWGAGEEPVVMLPRAPGGAEQQAGEAPTGDPIDALKAPRIASLSVNPDAPISRPSKSPAEHLGLAGKARAKAERCLSNAVYFEARSEPVRGQIAVAQVVLNRAFSGYYPDDVCGVVYQNANRHLSCQFTFACDGIPDVVTEQAEWDRAKRIARDTLDGKLWIREVNKSTHYHASYVFPYWVRSMRRMTKIGLHSFYRPRKWGDGSDELRWGNPVATAEAAKTM